MKLNIFASIILLALASCKSTDSNLAFDWDTDLTPNEEPADVVRKPKKEGVIHDKSKCKSKTRPCFTLLVNVPSQSLIEDQGLAVLAMANDSEQLASNLMSACRKAFSNMSLAYSGTLLTPVRTKFSKFIKKIGSGQRRCVINYFASEDKADGKDVVLNTLGDNDYAMSVRLSKFRITDTILESKAGVLKMEAERTKVMVQFRDVTLFGKNGKQVATNNGNNRELDLLEGTKVLGNDFSFGLDFEALKQSITNINPDDFSSSNVKTFFQKAKDTLLSWQGDSLAMLSFGLRTAKDICKNGGCTADIREEDKDIQFALNAPIPTAANEQFRVSSVRMLEIILEKSLADGNGQQFTDQWELK